MIKYLQLLFYKKCYQPTGRRNIFKRGYMSDLEMIFENTASECINIQKIV